jgi:hypothetical protein
MFLCRVIAAPVLSLYGERYSKKCFEKQQIVTSLCYLGIFSRLGFDLTSPFFSVVSRAY